MPFDEQHQLFAFVQKPAVVCIVYLLGGIHEGFLVACAKEANVYVLQRNIFVAEVFFGKFEQTSFEVTDVLMFLEILFHLPDEGALVIWVVINSYRCHITGYLSGAFSLEREKTVT